MTFQEQREGFARESLAYHGAQARRYVGWMRRPACPEFFSIALGGFAHSLRWLRWYADELRSALRHKADMELKWQGALGREPVVCASCGANLGYDQRAIGFTCDDCRAHDDMLDTIRREEQGVSS